VAIDLANRVGLDPRDTVALVPPGDAIERARAERGCGSVPCRVREPSLGSCGPAIAGGFQAARRVDECSHDGSAFGSSADQRSIPRRRKCARRGNARPARVGRTRTHRVERAIDEPRELVARRCGARRERDRPTVEMQAQANPR